MLVAGSVIIGRREEGKEAGSAETAGDKPATGGLQGFRDTANAPLNGSKGVSSGSEISREVSVELKRKPKGRAS